MNITTSYDQAVADLAQHAARMSDYLSVVKYSWAPALMSIYRVSEETALTDLSKAIERAKKFK